jgi:indole-3-glycerol phosphate synthase
MDVIREIVRKKAERLNYTKGKLAVGELKSRLSGLEGTRDFKGSISRRDSAIKLIAEVKKASPSKGPVNKAFDLEGIISIYERKPVNAVSIITEEDFFMGELSFIPQAKNILTKPILRKDFIFDAYQIYESRANRADAILLIAAILEKSRAEDYSHLAYELGMDVLFEVHDEDELQTALDIKAGIIGINNRNLKTMDVDLTTTLRLKKYIPVEKIVVAESGIRNRDDVMTLNEAGIDAMLIGTSLMQAGDIAAKIDELTLIF